MSDETFKYEEKYVAFIDILGFKSIVEKSNTNEHVEYIIRIMGLLGSDCDRTRISTGTTICQNSKMINGNLDIQVTQCSDSVIISTELSPAGAINIINLCRTIYDRLILNESILCRGYITKGKIYHKGTTFFGPAYQIACDNEKYAASVPSDNGPIGRPFIEIDPCVGIDLKEYGEADECIKLNFNRYTKEIDGYLVISLYKSICRMAGWAFTEGTTDTMRTSLGVISTILNKIEGEFLDFKSINYSVNKKIMAVLQEINKARIHLEQENSAIDDIESPFPPYYNPK
jgi:hypothetical protein